MPRYVDLTLPLRPGDRGVASEPARTLQRDGWNAATWHIYSHAGTHMDARVHFGAGDETIDQHMIARCIGPAWILDLPDLPTRALITTDHLGALATRFIDGESILLRTGWSRFVDDPARYRDGLPRLSDRFARWCVEHRVKLLGVEAPSVADVNDLPEVTRIHEILLGGGVTIVEGLAHLDRLTQDRVVFAALPLPLVGGDGSPVRAFAIEGISPEGW